MTLVPLERSIAASPTLASRTGTASAPITAAADPSPWPNAPKSTLPNERFIARLITMERINPDAPSSAPAMISTLLSSAKPVADAARPAYEFRSEITAGMSAPPIGITNSTPSTSATTNIR